MQICNDFHHSYANLIPLDPYFSPNDAAADDGDDGNSNFIKKRVFYFIHWTSEFNEWILPAIYERLFCYFFHFLFQTAAILFLVLL